MNETSKIIRKSLHHELIPLLRDMILIGELRPGEKVNEQGLCVRFGVSRTPLREALKVLASEGLVILTPNRGAMIARISDKEIDELFPIIGALEALAGETACAVITAAQLHSLQEMHDKMVEHYSHNRSVPYLKLNQKIHATLFEIAANAELTQLYNNLIVRTHSARFVAKKSPERWREAVEDHELMMQALARRDGSRLGQILREHLRHKAETVHEALVDLNSTPGHAVEDAPAKQTTQVSARRQRRRNDPR